MSATTVTRPASPADVVALQYANPTRMVTIPIGIVLAVVAVMAVVTAVLEANGAFVVGYNGSVVWSVSGYLVAIGVQAVSVCFPIALALGSTRRVFTLGVLATAAVQSAMLTAAALLLLGVELLTGGWFVGARVLRDATLGSGDPLLLAATVFIGGMTALAVGGLFGAAHVRFGSRGPAVLGLALAAAVVLALLVLLPALIAAAASFRTWWLVVVAAVIVAACTLGEYLLLRRASVR